MTPRRFEGSDDPHPPVRAGTELGTVIVGPPIAGLVGTWSDDEPHLWRVDDPQVAGLIGRGLVARTEIEPGRYREVGLLSSGGDLLLQRRWAAPDGSVEAFPASLEPAGSEARTLVSPDRGWGEFSQWLGEAVEAASVRGEFVLVEPGGWESSNSHFALFVVAEDEATGILMSNVESVPAPRSGIAPWDAVPPGLPGYSIRAPVSRGAVGVVGLAIAIAVSEWARSPWDLVLTFGRAPAGPIAL